MPETKVVSDWVEARTAEKRGDLVLDTFRRVETLAVAPSRFGDSKQSHLTLSGTPQTRGKVILRLHLPPPSNESKEEGLMNRPPRPLADPFVPVLALGQRS